MKKLVFIFLIVCSYSYSQVGVNTTTPQGALDVSSTTDGLLIPRVALTMTTSASPLTSPVVSEIVYNTATVNDVSTGFYYWDGAIWVKLLTASSSAWNTTGNSGTSPGTNFIGNTDNVDFVVKTNNTQRAVVKADGTVVIGAETLSAIPYNANSGLRINIPNSNTTALSGLNIKYRATPTLTNAAINVENDTQTAITQWGIFNSVVGLGTDKIGLENRVTGGGNGYTYGVINRLDVNNITNLLRAHYGFYNTMTLKASAAVYGKVYGNYNLISVPSTTTHTDDIYGLYNELNTLAASNVYGTYTKFTTNASSTGTKYGSYVEIPTTDAGQHYGIYSDVRKSGGYSGYFLGNVTVKNDIANKGVLYLDNEDTSGFAGMYFSQGAFSGTNYRGHVGHVNSTSTFAQPGTFQIASGDRDLVFSATNGSNSFTERMRINNDTGYVGINTNPTNVTGDGIQPATSNLHVNGSIAVGFVKMTVSAGTTYTIGNNVSRVIAEPDSNSGTSTIEIPDPTTCPGRIIAISIGNSFVGRSLRIDPVGSNNIQIPSGNLNSTTTITGAATAVIFWSDGVNWYR